MLSLVLVGSLLFETSGVRGLQASWGISSAKPSLVSLVGLMY
jgi:hypothetical protein